MGTAGEELSKCRLQFVPKQETFHLSSGQVNSKLLKSPLSRSSHTNKPKLTRDVKLGSLASVIVLRVVEPHVEAGIDGPTSQLPWWTCVALNSGAPKPCLLYLAKCPRTHTWYPEYTRVSKIVTSIAAAKIASNELRSYQDLSHCSTSRIQETT